MRERTWVAIPAGPSAGSRRTDLPEMTHYPLLSPRAVQHLQPLVAGRTLRTWRWRPVGHSGWQNTTGNVNMEASRKRIHSG